MTVERSFLIHMLRLEGVKKRRPRRLPPPIQPTAITKKYTRDIQEVVDEAFDLAMPRLVPMIPGLLKEQGFEVDADVLANTMEEIRRILGRQFNERWAEQTARAIGRETDTFSRQQFSRNLSMQLGFNFRTVGNPVNEKKLDDFVTENVNLIKSVPADLLTEIEGLVRRSVRAGRRASTIESELVKRFGIAENRAALIARDQVSTFAGQTNRLRQENLGVDTYTWQTAEDERVRSSHQDRNNVQYLWTHEHSDGHPGEPIGCRCWANADVEAILDAL